MGFSNANTIILLNKYFKRRVGAAFGILLTGLGLGGLAMPQVLYCILEWVDVGTLTKLRWRYDILNL
jgi:hypothetical protein